MKTQYLTMSEGQSNLNNCRNIKISALLGLLIYLLFGFNRTAHAGLCIVPAEQGTWNNNNQNTNSITKLTLQMECRDTSNTVCDGNICSTTSAVEPHYFINLYGKCHPTDCDWGRAEGTKLTGDYNG